LKISKRDYSLGRARQPACRGARTGQRRLVLLQKSHARKLKEFMQAGRTAPAIRDTLNLGLPRSFATGTLGFSSRGELWWAVPCFAVYGAIYGSSSGSRWHELLSSHRV